MGSDPEAEGTVEREATEVAEPDTETLVGMISTAALKEKCMVTFGSPSPWVVPVVVAPSGVPGLPPTTVPTETPVAPAARTPVVVVVVKVESVAPPATA